MSRKEFRKLLSADKAREIITALTLKTTTTIIPIEQACGRTLSENITTGVDVPPFDRSSMDGYAVQAIDTYRAREDRAVSLQLIDSIHPGKMPKTEIVSGQTIEVATGALLPKGADAVVMVENTEQSNNITETSSDTILIKKPVSINENTMHAGADMMIGERVLKANTVLTPREIGVLAAIGQKRVSVKTLRVGIISTGNELTPPGETLPVAHIYDTNTYALAAAINECGAVHKIYGIVPDNRQAMTKILQQAIDECDLVLTSGSTSAGSSDIMYQIIAECGILLLHGINIKPGKPAIFGIIDNTPVIGLPGYPTSALTIFNEFIAPKIRTILSHQHKKYTKDSTLAVDIHTSGKEQLLHVSVTRDHAYPADKGSGAITTLAYADGFIHVPSTTEIIEAGTPVKVTLFGEISTPEILFIGSHCLAVDIVEDLIPYTMRTINTGSTGGVMAIKHNHADIAGIHLLDENGNYNISYLKKYNIKNAALIKGYLREQGIIARDKNITVVEDLIGKTIINRNTGSGTRILTDLLIKRIAEKRHTSFKDLTSMMPGYYSEAKTHSAVASAVKLGKADAGIGIKPVATLNKLYFSKIADEEYDLLVTKQFLKTPQAQAIIEILKSKKFKEQLPDGISTYKRSGEVIEL